MPAISTTVYPKPAYVRVEVNWADVPAATGVQVERVHCITGARTPLRPYVAFDGDFLDLSCGTGIFWDTEAPLDTCFFYCTSAVNAAGAEVTTATAPLFRDLFDRTSVDTWGTATDGHVYGNYTGPAANFDVNAGNGKMTVTATPQNLEAQVLGLSTANGVLTGRYKHPVTPTGADHQPAVRARYVDGNNFVDLRWFLHTSGTVNAVVRQVMAGVESHVTFTSGDIPGLTATTDIAFSFTFWGSQLRVKMWPASTPEPSTYVIDSTTDFFGSGTVAARLEIPGGSTNVTPYTGQWDDLLLLDPCNTTTVVEQCSDNLTVPSSNEFRLGDPVRPCNDVILQLADNPDPACVPTQGIFFGNISTDETFASNSAAFTPVNAEYPITVSRTRMKGQEAALTVVTRTFPDRDDLRDLNAPGGQLFLRSPAAYGVGDRYMQIGDVAENRPVSDHKVAPRAVTMPHQVVARGEGPSQGVCGTRVRDLCDIYTSLDALAASGLTWADVLRGKASLDTPKPASVERTWNDVNATYADWNAVQAGNTDWDDLEQV